MAPDTLVRLENELLRPDGANEIVLAPEARYCLVMQEETERQTQAAKADSRFRLDFHVPGQLRNFGVAARNRTSAARRRNRGAHTCCGPQFPRRHVSHGPAARRSR